MSLTMVSPSQGRYAAQWNVQSLTGRIDKDTDKIAEYKVSRLFDETWQCSCWAWRKYRYERGDCKHIKFVQESNLKPAKEVIEGQEIVEHEGYKITRPKGFDALKLELQVSGAAATPEPKRRSRKRTGVTV